MRGYSTDQKKKKKKSNLLPINVKAATLCMLGFTKLLVWIRDNRRIKIETICWTKMICWIWKWLSSAANKWIIEAFTVTKGQEKDVCPHNCTPANGLCHVPLSNILSLNAISERTLKSETRTPLERNSKTFPFPLQLCPRFSMAFLNPILKSVSAV